MYLSKNNNHKLNLLALTISFSSNIFASELSLINNNSVSLKQPTEIVSSDGKINLNSTDESLTINISPAVIKNNFNTSYNQYKKFNVSEHGIKINNATNNPANFIITEVTSTEKSNINGNITILGENKPRLLIVNPNGINCSNLCSITNVEIVKLTTDENQKNNASSNQLTNNIRNKQIHFKNIKQENFTDAKIMILSARSIKLESSQLNVNDINIVSTNNTNKISNTAQDIALFENAGLTIDRYSAINSKNSYFEIKNGSFDNTGTISNNENSEFKIENGNLNNEGTISSKKHSHFKIKDGTFNNKGTIFGNEHGEFKIGNSNLNNEGTISSNHYTAFNIKDGTLNNKGTISSNHHTTFNIKDGTLNNKDTIFGKQHGEFKMRNGNLNNEGTIFSNYYTAFNLTDGTINNKGTIFGNEHDEFKIRNSNLNNEGTISSNKYTVFNITDSTLNNKGAISSNYYTIFNITDGTLNNEVTISSNYYTDFNITDSTLNNKGTISSNEYILFKIKKDTTSSNVNSKNKITTVKFDNDGEIKSKNGIYEIKNGNFENNYLINHTETITIRGENSNIINTRILLSDSKIYDLTELKSSTFLDFSNILPQKRKSNNYVELDLSENIM